MCLNILLAFTSVVFKNGRPVKDPAFTRFSMRARGGGMKASHKKKQKNMSIRNKTQYRKDGIAGLVPPRRENFLFCRLVVDFLRMQQF
jgi:hypothetical protein